LQFHVALAVGDPEVVWMVFGHFAAA
jgi:hypothetical protein